MIESFDRLTFEAALPAYCRWCKCPVRLHLGDRCPPREEVKDEGHLYEAVKLWRSLGLIAGEYSYLVPVRHPFAIMIRSSVHADGKSASSGEDSIRCWLIRTDTMQPMGTKTQRWVTRSTGWAERLHNVLRLLYKLGLSIKICQCGEFPFIVRIKKGHNKGKFALSCSRCKKFDVLGVTIHVEDIRRVHRSAAVIHAESIQA